MKSAPKAQAIQLRREGKSYNEISRALLVPKSTLSGWFRDLRLSSADRKRLMAQTQRRWAENIIRYNHARAAAIHRETALTIAHAADEIGALEGKILQLVGSALYWAEGGKTERWRLRFSNTDPAMIQLMMRFFRETCHAPLKNISCTIHLHPHVSEGRAKRFWSRVTGLTERHFRRSQRVLSRASRGRRPSRRLPHGTLHVVVSGVNIRNRVMGWIQGLQKSGDANPVASKRGRATIDAGRDRAAISPLQFRFVKLPAGTSPT